MKMELELLKNMESDRKWLDSRIDSIRKMHTNEFVAVKEGEIIESDKNFQKLMGKLKKKGKDPSLLLIRFIPKKGVTFIL